MCSSRPSFLLFVTLYAMALNKEQLDTLAAIAGTVVGELSTTEQAAVSKNILSHYSKATVDDAGPFSDADTIAKYLQLSGSVHRDCLLDTVTRAPKRGQQSLKIVLNLLSTRIGTFLLTGYTRPFKLLTLQEREKVFLNWKNSSFTALVSLHKVFHGVSVVSAYRDPSCKVHPAVGYPVYDPIRSSIDYKPQQPKDRIKMLTFEDVTANELHFDVIIAGSGAGGGKFPFKYISWRSLTLKF